MPGKEEVDDVAKLRFAREELLSTEDHFAQGCVLDDDLLASLNWASTRTSDEAIAEREGIMCRLEEWAKQLRFDGACSAWLADADAFVRTVSASVNGPALAALASEIDYHDPECVRLFIDGGQLVGILDNSGNGVPVPPRKCDSVDDLVRGCLKRNTATLGKVREDLHSGALFEMCRADAGLGRMSEPRAVTRADMTAGNFSQRFCVEQGLKPDGSQKLRAVDDFTASGCNPAAAPTEKLKNDTLDTYVEVLRHAHVHFGANLTNWKADIDSAYRRVPVAPRHRDFAWIAFKHNGVKYISQHFCLPFGSMPAVHHWDRVGAILRAIARRKLFLPVLRFVDDFYAVGRAGEAEHSMGIFARLVRCLLGPSAIADRKLECGNPLVILGVRVNLSSLGIGLQPEPSKVVKWCKQIAEALASSRLTAGDASKLAGRLMWTSQFAFKRVGRAMLYAIFRQQHARSSAVNLELRLALEWWLEVLSLDLCQTRPWLEQKTKPMHMLCDARSTPPRVAAVLLANKKVYYSDMEPSAAVMDCFRTRGDNQIMSLELLSIAFGLSVFEDIVRGQSLHVHSDNTGAQHCTSRGMARSFDHTCLVHGIWTRVAELNTGLPICSWVALDISFGACTRSLCWQSADEG